MTRGRTAWVMAALLGCSAAVATAGRTDEPRPLVSVPVFVTDARGHSIANLQAPDFEIRQSGAPQKIAAAVYRGGSPRRVAFFLDEYHVAAGAPTDRARTALARFVERHLRPDDAVAVMKPLDPRGATAPLAGIEAVHRAIAAFDGRRGNYEPRSEFEGQHMSVASPTADRQRAQVVRAGLETLALAMREEGDAARAIVIVTGGFSSSEPSRFRMTTLRSIGRAARLSNVPVYIIDPSPDAGTSALSEEWAAVARQTGGMLFPAGADLDAALGRIAADLQAHYVVEFDGGGREDGRFHDIDVRVTRRGAQVRAASGYWAPFGPSRLPPMTPQRAYASLLTPHVTGLIQPWFRMSPGTGGRTRVTFSWAPRGTPRATPERVEFSALTFEGKTLHAATVTPVVAPGEGAAATTFEAPPGPLQVSMAIGGAKPLGTDVRYIDVPRLDADRPHIAAIEFIRPRSLPEFKSMQSRADVLPTEVRDFLRRDRLLVRVRAYSGAGPVDVRVRLRNRLGHTLLDLPVLPAVGDASQFELGLARFPRGEYQLQVQAGVAGQQVTQLLTIRIIG
jgi:VWFA-related protein